MAYQVEYKNAMLIKIVDIFFLLGYLWHNFHTTQFWNYISLILTLWLCFFVPTAHEFSPAI